MEYRTNSLIENIKSEILHFANAHCSGDDINIYDVFKVIDDCCESTNSEIPTSSDKFLSELEKNSKKLEKGTAPNDCENCIHNKGVLECDMYGCKYEPTTKNNLGVDAVSRKELLKIYEDRFIELQKLKHLKDNKGAEDRQMGVNYCINILKELPSVTPIRPKGHWIKIGDRGFGYSDIVICKCSECEYQTEFVGKFDGHNLVIDTERADDYCSNCGADMREVEE
jgi:hypothetical protein